MQLLDYSKWQNFENVLSKARVACVNNGITVEDHFADISKVVTLQSMLRMVGYGDNVGSGFPTILNAWEEQGWETPELIGDTVLNQVTLILKMKQEKAKSSNIAQKVGVKEPFQLFYDRDTKKDRRNLS